VTDEKIKIYFIDVEDGKDIGFKYMYMDEVRKWSIGTVVQFKNIKTLYEIMSFAVNEGYPEGGINLKKVNERNLIELDG